MGALALILLGVLIGSGLQTVAATQATAFDPDEQEQSALWLIPVTCIVLLIVLGLVAASYGTRVSIDATPTPTYYLR